MSKKLILTIDEDGEMRCSLSDTPRLERMRAGSPEWFAYILYVLGAASAVDKKFALFLRDMAKDLVDTCFGEQEESVH